MFRVVRLRQQADVIAQAQEPLDEGVGARDLTCIGVRTSEPETAYEDGSLSGREAVDALAIVNRGGRIAANVDVVDQQLALDGRDGRQHAWIVPGQKTDVRDQQQSRIHGGRAVVLRERSELFVPALLEDLVAYAVPELAPAVDRPLETELLARTNSPVESHPHHDPRMSEMAWLAADFPDAVVRLVPVLLELTNKCALQRP